MRVISHAAFKKRLIKKCDLSLLLTSTNTPLKKTFELIDSFIKQLRSLYSFQSNFGVREIP